MGKTRLLTELSMRVRARQRLVLSGQAIEFEHGIPFRPFVDALDDHVAETGPLRVNQVGRDSLVLLSAVFPALVA